MPGGGVEYVYCEMQNIDTVPGVCKLQYLFCVLYSVHVRSVLF
jgi:hypothetical protein